MWRSVRIRWLSACAAAALLAVGLGGCHPGQTPASSDSSVVTDYPSVSTPDHRALWIRHDDGIHPARRYRSGAAAGW